MISNFTLHPYSYIAAVLLLISCQQQEPKTIAFASANPEPKQPAMLFISSFTEIPADIEGCACSFSNDSIDFKAGKFIYLNNNSSTSYVKINGVMTKFAEINHQEIDSLHSISTYDNPDYELILKVEDKGKNGAESSRKTGTLKLTDNDGKTIEKTFYGECGC
ncbi:hypothetical protein FMM05_10525 [Flavobacterium zepuense]|uniref:Uncharacterized protein n=1 Tax=Flavobacterium zepuense TaxID=2593302 RepID=A0A552V1A6_9FLAO|nr:hypothetical protein [Flavobacterium zepuense]TRW24261.1 hypothetical protein FMM05_10525 [Flavobacterium zepuense]